MINKLGELKHCRIGRRNNKLCFFETRLLNNELYINVVENVGVFDYLLLLGDFKKVDVPQGQSSNEDSNTFLGEKSFSSGSDNTILQGAPKPLEDIQQKEAKVKLGNLVNNTDVKSLRDKEECVDIDSEVSLSSTSKLNTSVDPIPLLDSSSSLRELNKVYAKYSGEVQLLHTDKVIHYLQKLEKELKNFIGNSRFKISNDSLKKLYVKIDYLSKEIIGVFPEEKEVKQ